MSPLDQWRREQHDDIALPSDHALLAFLTGVDPQQAYLDRAAHATDTEVRMISHTSQRSPAA